MTLHDNLVISEVLLQYFHTVLIALFGSLQSRYGRCSCSCHEAAQVAELVSRAELVNMNCCRKLRPESLP